MNRYATHTAATARQDIDAGLRAHMNKVYGLMSGALAITGIIAFMISRDQVLMQSILETPLKWVAIFGPVALAMILMFTIDRLSVGVATAMFIAYSAGMGVTMSFVFAAYTDASIAQAFGITAVSFLGLSLYGYTTKKDLGPVGAFFVMGLFGLIFASILNIFLGSSALDFAISIAGVAVFAFLTAWDTQKVKNVYLEARGDEATEGRMAVMGALILYLDFVNLMLYVLKAVGNQK